MLRFMGSQSRTRLRDWTELNHYKIEQNVPILPKATI